MIITNEPVAAGQPVKFTVKGWPDEETVKAAVERFYRLKPDADKNFIVHNAFGELIMSGAAENGQVGAFQHHDRRDKPKPQLVE